MQKQSMSKANISSSPTFDDFNAIIQISHSGCTPESHFTNWGLLPPQEWATMCRKYTKPWIEHQSFSRFGRR